VLNDGSVQCWGDNVYGQLGDGTNISKSSPVGIDLGLNRSAVMVGVGKTHTCAVLDDASVSCWGYNIHGQLGDGAIVPQSSPTPIDLGENRSAVSISLGESHTCAILDDSALKCWGYNNHGQLGDGSLTSRNTPTDVSLGSDIAVAVSTGRHHTCAILDDATVSCWGWNDRGQLGDGTTTEQPSATEVTIDRDAIAISTGDRHSCTILDNGSAMCWGYNMFGQLGTGNTADTSIPEYVDFTNRVLNIVGIVGGTHHSCAVLSDGSLYCWGANNEGQLGDGSTTSTNSPNAAVASLNLELDDRDRDNDATLDIFDTHISGDEDGDGVPTPADLYPTNPARSESCNAGFYGRYSCEEADAGYYAEAGSIVQIRCTAGTYQPNTGQSDCLDADMGYRVAEDGATSQDACDIGQYQALTGQTTCDDASPGYFVDSTGASAQNPCEIGSYQSNTGQSSCIDATPGNYVDTPASASQTPCSPGTYNPNSSSNASSACLDADLGN
jgi:hypothetical protein